MKWIIQLLALLVSLTLGMPSAARAEDLEDLEDIANESDAALAETADVKRTLKAERDAQQKKYDTVKKAHNSAVAKRQQSVDQMRRIEGEIQRFEAEQVRLKKDMERLEAETLEAQKVSEEKKQIAEKMKGEIETLKQLRQEKAQKFTAMAVEREKILAQHAEIENERKLAEQDFNKIKEEEKRETEALEKLRLETNQKKAKHEAYLAGLKERYNKAREGIASSKTEALNMERDSARMDAVAKTAESEVAEAEGRSSAPAQEPINTSGGISIAAQGAADSDSDAERITFKRQCRVFDGPKKKAKVIGKQSAGATAPKAEEGRTWVAFLMADGRKGYVAKGCVRAADALTANR